MSSKVRVGLLAIILIVACSQLAGAQYSIPLKSERAITVADNIIAWQTESGGWNKNIDFSSVMYQPGMSRGERTSSGVEAGTFDNSASINEMKFLAMMYATHGTERYKDAVIKGVDWMLDAQYPSGGWPQYYPLRGGYSDNVTFNDGAMTNVLKYIQEILKYRGLYEYLGEERFARLEAALDKGLEFILKAQIEVNGHLTAWCQQHDPVTYEPKMGRSYEHPSIVSAESVPIVEFLMSLPDPSDEVRRAILSALEWFEISRLPNGQWARFYDIQSNVPIFSGRDSIIRYEVTDIEMERQKGYSWFSGNPGTVLDKGRRGGYMDQLRESLPDHKSITIDVFTDPAIPKFNSPKIQPPPTVKGVLEIDIEISMRNPENLEEVVIKIDQEEVYRGNDLQIKVPFDTTGLRNGQYMITVETLTKLGTALTHTVNVGVNN
ncbi:MAG TPA: pectate lyase [Firmicutes bacterium]|nr:pectate lyase [Bacillota bacterium]